MASARDEFARLAQFAQRRRDEVAGDVAMKRFDLEEYRFQQGYLKAMDEVVEQSNKISGRQGGF